MMTVLRMACRSLIAAGWLCGAAAWAQAPAVPASKSFKEWEVACDNLRGCVAMGFTVDGGDLGYIRIARAAGAGAKPEVKIVVDENDIADFRVMSPAPESGAVGLAALIAAARKADRATIGDARGAHKAEFSLAGAAAALLFMDDVQGRVGGATSLMRPGPKPASEVPPAPRARTVKATATASAGDAPKGLGEALAKALPAKTRDECDRLDEAATASEAFAMGGGRTLVFLPCTAGAYNFSSLLFLVNGRDVRGARPVDLPEPDGKTTNGVTNGDYDPKTGQLTMFSKGRGLGDCGVVATYGWTGSSFALMEHRALGICKGAVSDDWPALWRNGG